MTDNTIPFDYDFALKKREALQIDVDNAFKLANTLQEKLNELDQKIEDYEEEQRDLDE